MFDEAVGQTDAADASSSEREGSKRHAENQNPALLWSCKRVSRRATNKGSGARSAVSGNNT